MGKTKVVSVALKECHRISPKAYAVKDFGGKETILPAMAVCKLDYEKSSEDCERWWIAEWILKKKDEEGKGVTWTSKREGWYDSSVNSVNVVKAYHTEIEHHVPEAIAPDTTPVEGLNR